MKTKEIAVVLVIDDNDSVRMMTVTALEWLGFKKILEASDGLSGVKMIRFHNPDLVITDLDMPGMRGEEVIELVAREHKPAFPGIKIIAMSGNGLEETKLNVRAAGADAFLEKPFGLKDLEKTAEALLAQA